MNILIMLFYFILMILTMKNALSMDAESTVLRAIRGRDARLPCGQGKVFLDGPNAYVVWFKNNGDLLYRFPNEDTETSESDRDRIFGTSCDSGVCHDDTSLLIKNVTDRDAGMYLCKVHYQASPSVDYVIDMRLVDSPAMPKVYNGDCSEITKGYVGPLSLGSNLTLICEVEDKQPDTLVYWRRNGVVIERAHSSRPGFLRVDVQLVNLTRSELDVHYECMAQNADVSDPLVASVVVKMYLPPLIVEIRLDNNYDFEAGQPRIVDCVIVGCVPPPIITWHLGDTMLRSTVHKELHDGNYTVSSLMLAPSLHDHRHQLVCTARNSYMPSDLYEDNVTVNVGYRPICQTNHDEKIGAIVRETEAVTCVVDSKPEPIQFSWTFADSNILYTSTTQKVPGYQHRYSSSLIWQTREADIGVLLCRATNAYGEQKKPCNFIISAGGPPAEPDCEVLRAYPNALKVQCKTGWNGGRPQTVHLEILDRNRELVANLSDPTGQFYLPNVMDNRNLTAALYAKNNRGNSGIHYIQLESLKPLIPSAVAEQVRSPWMAYVEALAGAMALAIAVIAIILGSKILISKMENPANPDIVPRADGTFHREPDVTRDERVLGTTNITVNQLAACQNQYSASPLPGCRVLVGCGSLSSPDSCQSSPQSYYV